jgi:ATP-dependent DNA ligase
MTSPQPALATLSHDRCWQPGRVHERKLDGQRCLAVRDSDGTRLYSRSGRDVTVALPEIAEGLIAKRTDAACPTGRADHWLKFKCDAGQELVVVGWTEPTGWRVALGALLLAFHDRSGGSDELVCAGKVGTGFSEKVLRDLYQRLTRLEVAFTEWTSAGQQRHPRYLGLRTDKAARDVVREAR